MFLTPDELRDLTHRTRYSAQKRALRAMGIEHRTRPDGSVAVLASHVEDVLGGKWGRTRAKKLVTPNWDALCAKLGPVK